MMDRVRKVERTSESATWGKAGKKGGGMDESGHKFCKSEEYFKFFFSYVSAAMESLHFWSKDGVV